MTSKVMVLERDEQQAHAEVGIPHDQRVSAASGLTVRKDAPSQYFCVATSQQRANRAA
jgi:hypothetical protein